MRVLTLLIAIFIINISAYSQNLNFVGFSLKEAKEILGEIEYKTRPNNQDGTPIMEFCVIDECYAASFNNKNICTQFITFVSYTDRRLKHYENSMNQLYERLSDNLWIDRENNKVFEMGHKYTNNIKVLIIICAETSFYNSRHRKK